MVNIRRTKSNILLGHWTEETLDKHIRDASKIESIAERIDFLSHSFLRTPYGESTLIGSASTAETFVVNLELLDCFTFLDYVEAMRLSSSLTSFYDNLRSLRYKEGIVSFDKRNHFFTDWPHNNRDFVSDITEQIGHEKTITSKKRLNIKDDGSLYLPGIAPFDRDVAFVPRDLVDEAILSTLQTGDYLGFFSPIPGLDVSHVGIALRKGPALLLRHASSAHNVRRVVDDDLRTYLPQRPGIVILRPH